LDDLARAAGQLPLARDGQAWAVQLRQLPPLERVIRNVGADVNEGLALANAQWAVRGQAPTDDYTARPEAVAWSPCVPGTRKPVEPDAL
jgi:hypothetical protein